MTRLLPGPALGFICSHLGRFQAAASCKKFADTSAGSDVQVMRRYHIQDRDDYKRYNRIVGQVTALVHRLRQLDSKDEARIELTDQLLDKCVPFPVKIAPLMYWEQLWD